MADRDELKARQGFEEYVRGISELSLERWPNGGYKHPSIQGQWIGWRECSMRTPVQPVAQMSGKIDNFLAMTKLWVERDGGDMDAALAWMYSDKPAATVPQVAQSVPIYQLRLSGLTDPAIKWADTTKEDWEAHNEKYRRIVYAAPPALAAPCVPKRWQSSEQLVKNTDHARNIVITWMGANFSDATFAHYIQDELAGDFVYHLALALLTTASNAGEAAQGAEVTITYPPKNGIKCDDCNGQGVHVSFNDDEREEYLCSSCNGFGQIAKKASHDQ